MLIIIIIFNYKCWFLIDNLKSLQCRTTVYFLDLSRDVTETKLHLEAEL